MNGAVALDIWKFALIYLLLIIVLAIMKKCQVNQTKLLVVASMRMTVQLVMAGLILTYIFENPHPVFTVTYIVAMTAFAVYRVLSKNWELNLRFKLAIGISMVMSGVGVLLFFIMAVVGQSIFNPQYVIPIAGMVMGNTMTGVNLGVKAFREGFDGQRSKIETLLNMGVTPQKILFPFVNRALEMAMLPTLNSMIGMGIVSLPGMMTGQMLSGTLPTTAILYQIAIMIALCTAVCLGVFGALYFGYQTMYNDKNQILFKS